MARVDYEAAWQTLQAEIAEKPSHGQRDLLVRMAELTKEFQIPEGLIEQIARLQGRPIPTYQAGPETDPAFDGDPRIVGEMDTGHRPPTTDGGHDGIKETVNAE